MPGGATVPVAADPAGEGDIGLALLIQQWQPLSGLVEGVEDRQAVRPALEHAVRCCDREPVVRVDLDLQVG